MKHTIRTLLLGLGLGASSLLGACGADSDPATENIFAELSEAEIFENVRILACAAVSRCEPDASEEECLVALDNDSAYQGPIEDAVRETLSTCVQSWELMSCEDILGSGFGNGDCAEVEEYLDLK